ncbi:hypothetical protein OG592_43265 (plasmid) [Streptomyces avidinii]|uniref:hypothetical protein n=1 Tax=Streptomyces avidinii TaxID=1895 RepID=UPI002F911C60|nr:hypothetical protein OG592_43265 [Streptomyces avidinii]
MKRQLSPGARWLAELAGFPRPTPTRNPWARDPLASIPIGGQWAVVRVPEAAADRACTHLRTEGVLTGPVLNAGHVRAFLVHPFLHDGRDLPGGVLLTGALGEQLRCPMPGQAANLSCFWSVPPDGSGALLDPRLLADALRTTWTPLTGPHPSGSHHAQDEGPLTQAGAGA